MKKTLTLIVATVVAATMVAQEQNGQISDAELKEAILHVLRPRFINLDRDVDENGNIPPPLTAERIAKGNNISHERMTRLLEEIIRENLPAINNGTGRVRNVLPLIKELQTFHGPNTIALLEELQQSKDERIRNEANIIDTKAIAQEQQVQTNDMIMPPLPPPRKRITFDPVSPEALVKIQERDKQRRLERENMVRDGMEKGITDDEALKNVIRSIFEMSSVVEHVASPISYTRWFAREVGVPRERLTKVLEDMIRENLSVIEKYSEKVTAPELTNHLMILLGTFPDYDIAPLAKEILQAKDSRIHYGAMVAYINLEGTKAIPFLLETMNLERYTPEQRKQLTEHLQRVAAQFNKENKADDAEKITAFRNGLMVPKPQETTENVTP